MWGTLVDYHLAMSVVIGPVVKDATLKGNNRKVPNFTLSEEEHIKGQQILKKGEKKRTAK